VAVPPALLGPTLRAAVSFAAGGPVPGAAASAEALALAKGALRATAGTKLAQMAALMLAAGVITYSLVAGTAPGAQRGDPAPPLPGRLPPQPEAPARRDAAGDLLPPGAVARLGTVRFRHGGAVTTVAYFPDGKAVASGGLDGVIRVWDAATGEELRRYPGCHLAVAPDGKTWASWDDWSTGAKIRLWDAATGKQLREFKRPGGAIIAAFSPDGKALAVGGVSAKGLNQLSLWEVATGKELPAPRMGQKYDYVYRLAFAPDGKTIATSGDDDLTVRFWDLLTGKELPPSDKTAGRLPTHPAGRPWPWGVGRRRTRRIGSR
jgi:hypothetical protein